MTDFLDLHGATNKAVRALADAMLQRHGLYLGQDHLLASLWRADGQTPRELALAAHVSTPAVVKMANRMVAAGLITRVRDDRDSRLVRLWLTESGRALQQPVEHGRTALEAELLAPLTKTETAQLLALLGRVHESAVLMRAGADDAAPSSGSTGAG
jgi:MarR family transcriptional regulator, organic hydroperoxide resistance regulator